jgi:hypothetical protein
MRLKQTYLLLFLMISVGCEKVIELDIDDSDKQVVIEADLYDGTHEFQVLVSYSSLYNEVGLSTPIENATVVLEDEMGNSVPIPYTTNGVYSDTVTTVPNRLYTLIVSINGEEYTAQSYMNEVVGIDTVFSEFQTNVFTLDSGNAVIYSLNDPAGVTDYYRIKVYENGILNNTPSDLRIFDDIPQDGFEIQRNAPGGFFDSGTLVELELLRMDETAFEYLTTLGDISGATQAPTPTPSNPTSNWSNNALGAFIAYARDTASIVVP